MKCSWNKYHILRIWQHSSKKSWRRKQEKPWSCSWPGPFPWSLAWSCFSCVLLCNWWQAQPWWQSLISFSPSSRVRLWFLASCTAASPSRSWRSSWSGPASTFKDCYFLNLKRISVSREQCLFLVKALPASARQCKGSVRSSQPGFFNTLTVLTLPWIGRVCSGARSWQVRSLLCALSASRTSSSATR